MPKTITFNELRRIKDSLPDGATHVIADKLNLSVETVRNYFGGANYDLGTIMGVHIEPGPDGGLVILDDDTILEMALDIIEQKKEQIKQPL
ncbi:MAG: DNA-binding protein [Muribaculaceae bacterium]|nr:DNA-binding protein [Muribaculaceae bacterium]